MARSAVDILKHQIGEVFVQCAELLAQNEALREELAKRPPAVAEVAPPAAPTEPPRAASRRRR